MTEDFRVYMLSAPCGGNRGGTVSQNTAATYFSISKAALKQAFIAKIKGIQEQESRREYLTVEDHTFDTGTGASLIRIAESGLMKSPSHNPG